MPRRGENIFKRKDGRWEARYIYDYDNGKAKYKYIYGKTYAEVKIKRNIFIEAINAKAEVESKRYATVEEIALLWLQDIRSSVKEVTYTRYHRIVNKYIIQKFGKMNVSKLDFREINRYSEELLSDGGIKKKSLAPKTVVDILCVIKSICKFGRINGYTCPTMEGIRFPQKSSGEIKIFDDEKRKMLEKILFTSSDSTSTGIVLAMFLGLRIGEICGLMWGDINCANATISISRTVERIADLNPNSNQKTKVVISKPKTAKATRTIPIPEFLREYIFKQKGNGNTFILTGTTDFIEPHCLYMRYKQFLRKNGIEDNTFHSLRHTFATRCVEEGFDTKVLAEILGHSSVTTTMNFYVHPSMENKRKQMELLAPTIH